MAVIRKSSPLGQCLTVTKLIQILHHRFVNDTSIEGIKIQGVNIYDTNISQEIFHIKNISRAWKNLRRIMLKSGK